MACSGLWYLHHKPEHARETAVFPIGNLPSAELWSSRSGKSFGSMLQCPWSDNVTEQTIEEKVSGLFSGALSSEKMPRWEDQNVWTKRGWDGSLLEPRQGPVGWHAQRLCDGRGVLRELSSLAIDPTQFSNSRHAPVQRAALPRLQAHHRAPFEDSGTCHPRHPVQHSS